MSHERFMQEAILLSVQNVQEGKGGPFGAVVVKDNQIIARGVNMVTASNDPTAHAEVVAIRNACSVLHDFQLTNCILYSSCEPCPMCMGAIFWARPLAVYFGATRQDAAAIDFDDSLIYEQLKISPENRNIPCLPLMREQALDAFTLWKQAVQKISY